MKLSAVAHRFIAQPLPQGSMIPREFLQRSRASKAFQEAIAAFARDGRSNERVRFDAYSPPVKVARTLTKMLEQHPDLEIERVEIDAASGCEFYRGELQIHAADGKRRIEFYWDCKWKAAQAGWNDYFGFPDQIRAAREFGYDCFREWEVEDEAPRARQVMLATA